MKKVIFIMLSVFIAGITFQSCGNKDAKLKQDIETALRARYSNISVGVKDKVVTLTGSMDSQTERTAVENIARAIPGVKSVVNNITVQPAPVVVDTDGTIRTSLESQYRTGNYTGVIVAVTDGEVVLTGNVKRADLQSVMQIANETEGVRKVTNNMTIE